MFTRIPDSSIKQGSVLGAVLISSVISLACFADDLSPAELRFLAIETEVAIESDWQTAPYDLKVEPQKGSLVVTRIGMGHFIADRAALVAAAADLFALIADGTLTVHVDRKYSLRDAAVAHRDLEERRTTGSLILIP